MADSSDIPVITIDGPGGSGKGTLSLNLAKKLKWHFLDSGMIYRALALLAIKKNIAFDDEAQLTDAALQMDIQFLPEGTQLEGENVSEKLRTPECSNAASAISQHPLVRVALLARQRAFQKSPGLVADGRDMGTVVFPHADLKIFLVASPEIRAKRRYLELQRKGINVSLERVLAELMARDKRDSEREVAPLIPAKDAWILDTSQLDIPTVLETVMQKIQQMGESW